MVQFKIFNLITYCWEGNGNSLQYSCLVNPTNGGSWKAAVHVVAKSWTRLSDFTFTFHFHALEKEWQPTPVFLPGEFQGWGSRVGCHLWSHAESDMLVVPNSLNKKLQRWGPAICVFIRLPWTCDYLWKFENHCSKNSGKTTVCRVLKKGLWRQTICISYCLTVYIFH